MERLLFKFYKSYFLVASELNDKDRLLFYDALMNKQFNGIEPILNGMSKFAYISQKHSVDSQVKGWEDKTGMTLNNPIEPPILPPTTEEEEKVKEKEKEEVKQIDEIYNLYPSNCPVKNSSTGKTLKNKDKIKSLLTSKSKDEIISIIIRYTKECKENKIYMKNFSTFLNNLPDYSQFAQQTVSKNRKVHYRMLGREHTHYEKAYFENLQSLGSEQVQFLNYVENAD